MKWDKMKVYEYYFKFMKGLLDGNDQVLILRMLVLRIFNVFSCFYLIIVCLEVMYCIRYYEVLRY